MSTVKSAGAAPVPGKGTWEITLQARDLDGDGTTIEAYYDTTLNITWLANANVNGGETWADQIDWASGLDINGVNGWRLPSTAPINGVSFDSGFSNNGTADSGYADSSGWVDDSGTPVSEMGHMYYVTLGNLGQCTPDEQAPGSCATQPGWGVGNTGPFTNLEASLYWSGSEFDSTSVFNFVFDTGNQFVVGKNDGFRSAWAVHNGDVGIAVADEDGDGVADVVDNCLLESNPGQRDTDGDSIGNACDPVCGEFQLKPPPAVGTSLDSEIAIGNHQDARPCDPDRRPWTQG